jgi:16S rRNA (adenine1518-N6/adenine1519-N6)-dimethyltransferase
MFFRLAAAGFKHRRKTFINSLSRSAFPALAEKTSAALAELGLSPRIRAENVSFEQFLALAGLVS